MSQSTIQAIQATLAGNWTEAILLNTFILKDNPEDLEALNRLAFAYTAQGLIKEAKATYVKLLKIDKLNPIALKNMKRLGESANRKVTSREYTIDSSMFLEEVGKTKVITLINTAPPKILRTLQIGQPISLVIKRLKIFALDQSKQFLGMLPDNVSHRLIKFMKGGNMYSAYIKSIEDHDATIFVKETKRVSKFKNQPSFVLGDSSRIFVVKKKNQDDEEEEVSEE